MSEGLDIFIKVLGYLASIFVPLAFLPQTLKTIIKRETKGISIISYTIFLAGCIGFLVFGILTPDIPMIICETIAGAFTTIILIIAIINYFKSRRRDYIPGKDEDIETGGEEE